jgi:hypothetical protein
MFLMIDAGVMPCSVLYGLLHLAAPFRLGHRVAHRVRHRVGVENRAAVHVPGRAAYRLNQRACGPEKAFLVRIQNGDQRDFRQIQPFAQQVDADEHIEYAQTQVAQNLHALQRVDVRVQVAHAHPQLLVVRASGLRPCAW